MDRCGDGGHSPAKKVLLALDGSEASRNAARSATSAFPDATVLAATVHHGAEQLGEREIAAEIAAAGIAAGRHGPLHELFVGNVAEKLLQLAPCPLLLAH